MPTHPSPVDTRSKVRIALPKFAKFACRFIVLCSFTSANRETPSTANSNSKRISKAPTLSSSGMAKMKVWKICCKFFAVLINFRTLAILNDRIIVVMLPTFMLNTCNSSIPIQADSTMMKSKTHQPSLKYLLPYAVILTNASIV